MPLNNFEFNGKLLTIGIYNWSQMNSLCISNREGRINFDTVDRDFYIFVIDEIECEYLSEFLKPCVRMKAREIAL